MGFEGPWTPFAPAAFEAQCMNAQSQLCLGPFLQGSAPALACCVGSVWRRAGRMRPTAQRPPNLPYSRFGVSFFPRLRRAEQCMTATPLRQARLGLLRELPFLGHGHG